jgi:N-dimethylarginine dimethylaminohydrolase
MSEQKINNRVLMSGVDYFSDEFAINAYMDSEIKINLEKAKVEHETIKKDLELAGAEIIKVDPPQNCQDGVYTANWGLCKDNKVILANLPNKRKAEEDYAEEQLKNLGFETIKCPFRFSGQGDALPCGNYLFMGTSFRTDIEAHEFVRNTFDYQVVSLQTIPYLDSNNQPVINKITGWADSFFYDIDLALSVISTDTIAWCPDAFTPESQSKVHQIPIKKIEVSYQEATEGFACNLVSNGETVVMSSNAPKLKNTLEKLGYKVLTPEIKELAKGGGYIRCTTLTLNN